MTEAGRFAVPAAHPALAGHFPGRPVVPGVVVLDHAFALILAAPGLGAARRIAALIGAKFTRPVLPEEEVRVAYELSGDRLGFTCTIDGAVAAHGAARLA